MNETEKASPDSEAAVKIKHKTKHGRHETVNVFLDSDDIVRAQVGGFVTFIREHAVVGVAIGFIIGLQAQTLVKQLVTSFVTPFLTLVVGAKLQARTLIVHPGPHQITFAWGQFVYALADFVVVLFFIYLIVKLFSLDKLDKPPVLATTVATSSDKKS